MAGALQPIVDHFGDTGLATRQVFPCFLILKASATNTLAQSSCAGTVVIKKIIKGHVT